MSSPPGGRVDDVAAPDGPDVARAVVGEEGAPVRRETGFGGKEGRSGIGLRRGGWVDVAVGNVLAVWSAGTAGTAAAVADLGIGA